MALNITNTQATDFTTDRNNRRNIKVYRDIPWSDSVACMKLIG